MIDTVNGGGEVASPAEPSVKTGGDAPITQGTDGSQTRESVSVESGGPQGSSEDGQSTGGGRSPKLLIDRDEILALRNERRTWRQSKQEIEELRAQIEELTGRMGQTQQAPSKTARTFWEDPDGALQALREEILGTREHMTKTLESVRTQDQQRLDLAREKSEAVKLIRSQPNWSEADEPEIVDLIEDYGLGALPPLKAAEIAVAMFQKKKGIRDTTSARNRASSITGAPPAGPNKVWTKAEVDRVLDLEIKKGPKMNQDLIDEIKLAQAEGRIR